MSKKLEELREKIDGIDEKIVKLYRERMDVTKDIAAYKKCSTRDASARCSPE